MTAENTSSASSILGRELKRMADVTEVIKPKADFIAAWSCIEPAFQAEFLQVTYCAKKCWFSFTDNKKWNAAKGFGKDWWKKVLMLTSLALQNILYIPASRNMFSKFPRIKIWQEVSPGLSSSARKLH